MESKNVFAHILFGFACITLVISTSCGRKVSGLQVKCGEKGAEVFMDGKSVGTCPVNLTPAAGSHILTIKKGIDTDTFFFYEDVVTVKTGEALKVNAKLGLRFTEETARKIENDFVLVKGNCFQMGDVIGDGTPLQKPVHEVCLDDYFISKYEATQWLWQKVMGGNPSSATSDRYPVDNISWKETQEFITRLNGMTRMNYRLPTEAEWEFAARSGGNREKWAGTNKESELPDYAWYGKDSSGLHSVGVKKPNGLGLYDMTGSVCEIVKDGWSKYSSVSQRNPQGPETLAETDFQNVVRDGGNNFKRGGGSIYRRDPFIGFRLAHSVKKEK